MFPQDGVERLIPTTTQYQQPPQQHRTSSYLMPQGLIAMSQPQPIAAAPIPPNSVQHMQSVMTTSYSQPNMLSNPGLMDNVEHFTRVVGSQGRRGTLPSAPGRPTVTEMGTGTTKKAMIPAKDADGKFPCPHCTKTTPMQSI